MARSGSAKWLPIAIPVALIVIGLPIVLVIALDTFDGNESSPGPTPAAASVTPESGAIQVRNFAFEPEEIQATAGTPLTFQNVSTTEHRIQIDDGEEFELEGGESFEWTPDEPGEHTLKCTVHPQQMTGTITVS